MYRRYLEWSLYSALFLASLSILLAFFQIVGNFGPSSVKGKREYFDFGSANSGVLLLSLRGPIHEGEYGQGIEPLIKSLAQAKESKRVRAVLLWINSPGGTVEASKRLYEQILDVRKNKPIVALVGDLAASGAYYAAAASSRIIASPASVVGSIGVLSVRLEVYRFLEKHGIRARTLKAGRFKDMTSPFRSMTDIELRMYQGLLDEFYQLFLRDLAAGRKVKLSKVRTWAEGKIFSGRRALRLGMLDALGGRKEALEEIKKLLKTKDDLKLIEPVKDLEFYLQKYLSATFGGHSLSSRIRIYESLLESPILYLYPQMDFFKAIRTIHAVQSLP